MKSRAKLHAVADEPGDAPAQAKARELTAALESAADEAAVDAAAAEFEKHRKALDADQQTALEIAVSKARQRVGALV